MAATAVIRKNTFSVRLNDGTTPTGGTKTVTQNMGSVKDDIDWTVTANAQKALAVANAYENIAEKSIVDVRTMTTYELIDDE